VQLGAKKTLEFGFHAEMTITLRERLFAIGTYLRRE
jgi:hypothetical protein